MKQQGFSFDSLMFSWRFGATGDSAASRHISCERGKLVFIPVEDKRVRLRDLDLDLDLDLDFALQRSPVDQRQVVVLVGLGQTDPLPSACTAMRRENA